MVGWCNGGVGWWGGLVCNVIFVSNPTRNLNGMEWNMEPLEESTHCADAEGEGAFG